MPQGTTISFVVYPTGEIDENSLTVSGERIARERFIAGWLPSHIFGEPPQGYAADGIWRGAAGKGFKSYTIAIDGKGNPVIANK